MTVILKSLCVWSLASDISYNHKPNWFLSVLARLDIFSWVQTADFVVKELVRKERSWWKTKPGSRHILHYPGEETESQQPDLQRSRVCKISPIYFVEGEGLRPRLNGVIKWTKGNARVGGVNETRRKMWIEDESLDLRESETSLGCNDHWEREDNKRVGE